MKLNNFENSTFGMVPESELDISIVISNVLYLLESLPIGIMIVSVSKGIVAINGKAKQLLGITDENIIGFSLREVSENCGLNMDDSIIRQSLSDRAEPTSHIRRLKNGNILSIYASFVKNTENMILIFTDITEQTKQHEWTRALLGAIGDGIIVRNRNREIVWTNEKMKEWFGDRLSETPLYCYALWTGSDMPCPDCPADKTFDTGNLCKHTEKLLQPDGSERFFDIVAAPITTNEGKVELIVQIARDVTDREYLIRELMQTRIMLEDVNNRLERQFAAMRTIIEITDTLQEETKLTKILRIILTAVTAKEGLGFNRAFLLLVEKGKLVGKIAIGPSNAEEAGRVWSQLVDGAYSLSEILRRYQLATEKYDIVVNTIVRGMKYDLDGSSFLVRVLKSGEAVLVSPEKVDLYEQVSELREKLSSDTFAIVPLKAQNKALGIIIADNMITRKPISAEDMELLMSIAFHAGLAIERSRLSAELEQSYKRLEEAYATLRENQRKLMEAERLSTIGSMAAQIAHEIRNPLVSIGGFARSLLQEVGHSDPSQESLKIIIEEVERLERLVHDVLGYARLTEPNRSEKHDINQTIYNTLLLFEPEFEERKIAVEVQTSEDIPAFEFDEDQMRQVFINLIRNSLGVLSSDGRISIHTRMEGDSCWIEFTDNGPGIPKNIVDRIFDPFFTTRSTGTGLGLSIVAKIIKGHNGNIWFKNNAHGGVTFYITLPTKNKEECHDRCSK